MLDAIVIGAGAAGFGVGVALNYAGLENFAILYRCELGAKFRRWPAETRFITLPFPTNSIEILDPNSVTIGVSLAFSLGIEHSRGSEYETHLAGVAEFFSLPVRADVDVLQLTPAGEEFRIVAFEDTLLCEHTILSVGEFEYLRIACFLNSELCWHTAKVPSYRDLTGSDFVIIRGCESSVDAAYSIAKRGKRVQLVDKGCPWTKGSSRSGLALSPNSRERIREAQILSCVKYHWNCPIEPARRINDAHKLLPEAVGVVQTRTQPLFAAGLLGSFCLLAKLFEHRDDEYHLLNDRAESTITPRLHPCGPAVRQEDQVFYFICNYWQRLVVVARAIAHSLGLPTEELEMYRKWRMNLDYLSCYGEKCVC